MKKINKLTVALKTLRGEIGKKDILLIWVEFFLLVAAAGPKGITTKEVANDLGMTQGVASRMVKLMSRYLDPVSRKMTGLDLYVTTPDHEHLHRQRVILSAKGQEIAAKIEKL